MPHRATGLRPAPFEGLPLTGESVRACHEDVDQQAVVAFPVEDAVRDAPMPFLAAGSDAANADHKRPLRSVAQIIELVGSVSLKEIVRESTDRIERLCIEAALAYTADNRASAADILGLSRQSLYSKLHRYGLAKPRLGG